MKDRNLLLSNLYEAVIKTVNINGFHGSSIAMIAKQAHINSSNIYHYFNSKEELLMDTYVYLKEMVDEYIFENENFSNTNNAEQEFKIVFSKYIHFYQNKSVYISFMEQFTKSPYFTLLKKHNESALNGKITSFLDQKIKEGHFVITDIKLMKAFIFGAINNITYHIFSQTDEQSQDKKIDGVLQMLWNTLTTHTKYQINN